MTPEQIARVAHEVNRAYCQALGDHSQPAWDDAPQWQRDSALLGVRLHTENPDASPAASHASWMAQKAADGWVYGPEKRPDVKQHPCMVPFDQLPREQQAKDHIFRGVAHALARWPSAAPATTRHEAQPAAAGQAQRPAGWLAQHHDHIPRTVFVLLNELGVPQHCAAWPGGAQHHMDTLIADGSPPHSMGLWGVHEYVLAEAARPAASERERAGT